MLLATAGLGPAASSRQLGSREHGAGSMEQGAGSREQGAGSREQAGLYIANP